MLPDGAKESEPPADAKEVDDRLFTLIQQLLKLTQELIAYLSRVHGA